MGLSGVGQQLSDPVALEAGLGVFTMEHDGGSNFAIWLYDAASGERLELLVNEIGPWFGSRAIELPATGDYLLEVTADGNWSVEILQPTPATAIVESAPQTYNGTGAQAVYFLQLDGGVHRVSATHNGESNFAVWAYNSDASSRQLLFNEIGAFDGSAALNVDGGGVIAVFDIQADGDWTITVE